MKDNTAPLTTGDVARYCGVSRMGVIRWIRQGKLKAYSTPGGHYRIRLSDFRAFLERFDIPVDASLLGDDTQRILVVTGDVSTLGIVVKALSTMPEKWEVDVALDCSSAVSKVNDFNPDLVLLDRTSPGIETSARVQQLKGDLEQRNLHVLTLTAPASRQPEEEQLNPPVAEDEGSLDGVPLEMGALQFRVRQLLGVP